MQPTRRAEPADIQAVRPYLAQPFQRLSDEDLSWLDIWLVCKKSQQSDR
jgi:hypothetical protein